MTAPVPDVAGWLDRLEETHQAATTGPWFAWDRGVGWHICTEDPATVGRGSVPTTLPEGLRTDLARGADAAAIVAEHNSFGALLAAVRGVLEVADSLDVDSCDPMPDDRSRLLFDTAQRLRSAVAAALGAEVTGR